MASEAIVETRSSENAQRGNQSVAMSVQYFERGLIVQARIPRRHAPNQWYVLVEEPGASTFWSFITPISFTGPGPRAYRSEEHNPPPGFTLPDADFGSLWQVVQERLGWALGPLRQYDVPYTPDRHLWQKSADTAFTRLPGPEGEEYILCGEHDGEWWRR